MLLVVFKWGMGGNKLVGESEASRPVKKGEVCFIPANGGLTEAAVLLLFLVCCRNLPTMESIIRAKLAVISDLRMSARPLSSGLMLTNFSAISLFLPTVSASISLVIASLVALSCWSCKNFLAISM